MSFPFYNRPSSKPVHCKGISAPNNRHASSSPATASRNQAEATTHAASPTGHSRSSSKMRIIPFLGKRRKSMAALRSNTVPPDDPLMPGEYTGTRAGHHKTVSQLANETAARMARSSLGAVGSLSTGRLELPTLDTSPLKLGSAYSTPQKNSLSNARHTIFSGGTLGSTQDKTLAQRDKRSSEKPKQSFLSRVTSRPSLSSRYSSADLKSTSKLGSIKVLEAQQNTSRRCEIIYPAQNSEVGDDRNFFTSPRTAPTPPNMNFASPTRSSQESLLGSSQSTAMSPGYRYSCLAKIEPGIPDSSPKTTSNAVKSSSVVTGHELLSPDKIVAHHVDFLPPDLTKTGSPSPVTTRGSKASPLPARRRPCHVRIGKEKVTLSVANVLETELGVEVRDSEEESLYADSFEDYRRSPSRKTQQNQKGLLSGNKDANELYDSSDLPLLRGSPGIFGSLGSRSINTGARTRPYLRPQGPLPIPGLTTDGNGSLENVSIDNTGVRFRFPTVDEAEAARTFSRVDPAASHTRARSLLHSKSFDFPPSSSLGVQFHDVDHLDRISERSILMYQESPEDCKVKQENEAACLNSAVDVHQLRQSLDIQCARFDRLAGHLLAIIQRHQNEKVQFESQMSTLKKEARRRDREIKGLRWLISRCIKRCSGGKGGLRRPVRVASMQSFLSAVSDDDDEEVDLSVAVEMLSRASHGHSEGDGDSGADITPGPTPRKAKKVDLRRVKTMPDLHTTATTREDGSDYCRSSPPQQSPSPDVNVLGLGLDFPLPEPLTLPSIASTIMTSAGSSSAFVPALTTAPTAASGLSIATKRSVDSLSVNPLPPPGAGAPAPGVGRGAGVKAREKRMAREWHPGPDSRSLYRPADPPSSKTPADATSASVAYANNLNRGLPPTIDTLVKVEENMHDSLDLEAIFQRLVANSNEL
ncbi:hypothetical protein M0805_000233 [Coniferiporia weirii]|nr:hypothetical protein M0805_000233 [Coniferiporia weirii]